VNPKQIRGQFVSFLWGTPVEDMPPWKRWLVRPLRIGYALAQDLADGLLSLRAMSLVYTTLLSLVPLIAVSFSVLKAFGVHNQLEPALLNVLEPLGQQGVEITNHILGFVDNMKVGVLGSVGIGLLLYTVVSLIQKIESALNYTWRVRRPRPLARRFSDYLSVIMVGPVLMFSALGITASVHQAEWMQTMLAIEPFGALLAFTGKLIPYLLVIGAFTFVYMFVPNTRVQLRSAFVGALVAGVLWQTAGWGFTLFVASSTKYTAIYSSLAILIVFMIWLYLSWLILLIGTSIAFYHQHPEFMGTQAYSGRLSNRLLERLALQLLLYIAQNFYRGKQPWTSTALARKFRAPVGSMDNVLALLQAGGLVASDGEENPGYLPARPLDALTIKQALDVIRAIGETSLLNADRIPHDPVIGQLLGALDTAVARELQDRTIKDLALGGEPPPAERAGGAAGT
jgi:membrane protein